MSLNCLFVRHNRVFVGKVKLRTYLSQNFNFRTSEANFIKKSALRGTAATCDSLVVVGGGWWWLVVVVGDCGGDGNHLHGVVDEAVEDALEEDLDDGARHPAGHVAHLLEVLLLGVLFPVLIELHHPDLLLHEVVLYVVEHLQGVPLVPRAPLRQAG